MKKFFVVTLFFSISCIYGMESNFYSSLFKIGMQQPYETERIKQIKKDKSEVVKRLQLPHSTLFQKRYVLPLTFQLFTNIPNEPEQFLQYMYYYEFNNEELFFNLSFLENDELLRQQCHHAQIEGLSGLGATIIASNVIDAQKNILVQKLLNLGFESTPKDREFAYLYWYEKTEEDRKKQILLRLVMKDQESVLSCLPPDLIRVISYSMYNAGDIQPLLSLESTLAHKETVAMIVEK